MAADAAPKGRLELTARPPPRVALARGHGGGHAQNYKNNMHQHHHHHHGEYPHEHPSHHDHHDISIKSVNRAFIVGIILNVSFIAVEVVAGLWWGSLALLSDAGHNASDVLGLLIALLAFRLMRSHPNKNYTYGYQKTSILAALFNAVILLVAIGGIIVESIHRFIVGTTELFGLGMAIVAGFGILINGATALLFMGDRDKDLNLSGVFWHMAADALISLGVVISGLVIMWTNWLWLDAVMSLLIAVFILLSTSRLLYKGWRLSLDGVPTNIDSEAIKAQILKLDFVRNIHDMHIWALSTNLNAFTAHIVMDKTSTFDDMAAIKHEIRHILEHANIKHVTIEIEHEAEHCGQNC